MKAYVLISEVILYMIEDLDLEVKSMNCFVEYLCLVF